MSSTGTSASASRGSVGPHTRGPMYVVGAGPGIGASVALRFAAAGHSVGLVARNEQRLSAMAHQVGERSGARVRVATADATDPAALRAALASLRDSLGDPAAMCFSPIPDIGLIKPVLETAAEDLMSSLKLNVAGAAAAVESVLPAMLAQGHGSLLFTTGSAAIHPDPARAASAVTTTAATVYISLLHKALAETPVRVGHTVIAGPVAAGRADAHDPDDVAADLWAHHQGIGSRFPSVMRLTE